MDTKIASTPVDYPVAVEAMEQRVAGIHAGTSDELMWLLEHPALYTGGTSAHDSDLLAHNFPVYKTGRGGQYTYHGPGQRVGYFMLDLKKRQSQPDIKHYIWQLEEGIIRSLAAFDIEAFRREGRVGIWVSDRNAPGGEAKIAAIGVRVRHWITYHGIAVNLNPDLSHFTGIVPCGINQFGVTSIEQQRGAGTVTMDQLDESLVYNFKEVFGKVGAGRHMAM
jgi:lipoyl(octanoyl) transferase